MMLACIATSDRTLISRIRCSTLWFAKNRLFVTDRLFSNIEGRIGPYARYGSSKKVITQSRSKMSACASNFPSTNANTDVLGWDRGSGSHCRWCGETIRLAVIRSQYARFDEVWFVPNGLP